MPGYLSRILARLRAVPRASYSATATLSIANGIATASGQITEDAGAVVPGDPVELRMGLDADLYTVFRGEIPRRGVAFYPGSIQWSAVGQLYKARRKTNFVDTTWPGYVEAIGDPDLETPPNYAYYAIGKTDQEHVAALLALAGITEIDLDGTGEIWGEIIPVVLPTGGSPWQLIQEIDRVTWYRTFDGPDGVVMRRPYTILPSENAAYTLEEGIDLFDGNHDLTSEGMVTNVHVVGASYMGADDYPIVIDYATDEPEANEYGINDVLEEQSELYETYERAEAWAQRALGEYGVLQDAYSWVLGKGYGYLRAGMTIAIVSPRYGLTEDSRFLIETIRHFSDGVEYITAIEVKGSASPIGTAANQRPIPNVAYSIHRETVEAGILDTVGLSAADSYDPEDGIVASYSWAGDPVDPTPIGNGERATVSYEGGIGAQSPYPPTVALTVTDSNGASATKTIKILPTLAAPIQTRDLWVAVGSALLYSPDGQVTWIEVPIEAVGVCRECAGYQLAWDAAGDLYKVQAITGAPALVLGGEQVTACSLSFDALTEAFTGTAYAGTADGNVWRSFGDGAPGTWVQTNAAPLGGEITTISESPYAAGQIQLTSGDKLYESYDAGVNFAERHAYGDPGVLAGDFSAGFGKGLIGYRDGAGDDPYVQERDDLIATPFPAADLPQDVWALTIAPSEQRFWALTEQGGEGYAWEGDLLAGGELVPKTWDTTNHGRPRDMIRDPEIEGLIYFAATSAVGKTLDGFATTLTVKALALPQTGRKLGIGPVRPPAQASGSLVWAASTFANTDVRWVYRLTEDGFERHAHPTSGNGLDSDIYELSLIVGDGGVLISLFWTRMGSSARAAAAEVGLHRSIDGGATWAAIPDVPRPYSLDFGGGGVWYSLGETPSMGGDGPGSDLYRSDDNGVTWSVVYSRPGGGFRPSARLIAVDPADPMRVLSKWIGGQFQVSTDGGATFSAAVVPSYDEAALEEGPYAAFSPDSSRIVWHPKVAGGSPPYYADIPAGFPVAGTGEFGLRTSPHAYANGAIYLYEQFNACYSEDNGATWANIHPDAIGGNGFVPGDEVSLDWYLLPFSLTLPFALLRRVAGTAEWDDLTPMLAEQFPDGAYLCYVEGAARLVEG